MSNNYLYVDIETAPDDTRLHLFGLPNSLEELPDPAILMGNSITDIERWLDSFAPTLPTDYLDWLFAHEESGKNRSGIFKAIEKAREAAARQRTELSVTPEFCRCVALGWAEGDGPIQAEVVGLFRAITNDGLIDERYILKEFWRLVSEKKPTIVGFNILDFDLRVLLVRSALLGVRPTRLFDLKPWGRDCIDLMKLRFPMGKAMGLKRLAKLYGLPVPVEDVDGSMIADLIMTDSAKVGEYVKSDVDITRQLHRFYAGYFCESYERAF